ncbi:MAG TPA: hypothetical protein VIU62_12715, partial [Chloroflexota bacterium]
GARDDKDRRPYVSVKIELHRLVDELPETEVIPARRFLEYLRDTRREPVLDSLMHAPEDDEPLTPADEAAMEEAKAAYRRGDYLTADEAKREILA